MKVLFSTALMVMLLSAFAGTLMAAPPYDGYSPVPTFSNDGSPYGFWITKVAVKQGTTTLMSNTSGYTSSPYYTYYSGVTPPNMVPNTQHTLEVTFAGGSYTMGASAWIDYNNNGVFTDTNESLGNSSVVSQGSGATVTITFTPPSAAGILRLRVRAAYSSNPNHPTTTFSYGESEDYLVNMGFAISSVSPLSTGAVGSAYNTVITAANGVTPYNWQGNPTYLIAGSLPPGLTAAPQGSPNYGLVISGTPSGTGVFNFTVQVNDSKTPTPDSSTKAFQITVVPPPAALPFNDDFSTFTGWQLGATWQRSPAVAYTATSPNREEPGTDHTAATTDNYILGDTIGGNYAINMSGTNWAVSPMVNCSTATTVRLSFWRFMGLALDCPNGGGTIQVTNNGTTWTNVWQSTGGTTYKDTAWTSVYYDLTSVAAGAATVQVRFGIGPTGATLHTGWCIDDLKIEQPGPDLVVREGGPTGAIITDNQAVGGARDFGQVNASTVSAPLNLYLTNNGPANITFGAYTKTGAQPNDFYINTSSFVNPLPVGQSTTITITFYRTTVGVSTATFNLPHNATGSGTSPFEVNLRGEAIVPNPDIEVRLGSATGPVIPHNQSATGTPRDFGNQDINAGPSGTVTIFIKNTGTGQLNISTPDMGGNWWNQFVVDSTGLQSGLTAGQSTTFTVAFDPTSVGSKDAYVRLPHTDTGNPSPYYIPVLGNGTTSTVAGMTVSEGPAPGTPFTHNAAAAGLRDFGNQLVAGGATPAITINILSSGGVALNVGTPTIGGTTPGEFVLDTTGFTAGALAPGASTSFTVAFDPTSTGTKTATISFTHDDTTQTTPFIVNVKGVGVSTAPILIVRETNAAGAQLPNPAPATGLLNFGNQDVNAGPTAARTIYIENTGSASLTVSAPSFTPATTEFQLQSAGFAGTIAVGASATFTITFDPTSAGTKTGIIQFTHNDSGAGTPFVLNVTGNAVLNAPVVEVREGSYIGPMITSGAAAVPGGSRDLGSIDVNAGNTFPLVISIVNSGNLNLTLSMPNKTGVNFADFGLSTSGYVTTLAPGANTQFDIVFDPTLAGIKDCQVEITHNDPGRPSPFIIRFMGTGTDTNAVTITTATLPGAVTGHSYAASLDAANGTGPYTWSLYSGTLPAGLSLLPGGSITGTPSGFGSLTNVVIRVTDMTGATNEKSFALQIQVDPNSGKAKDNGCAVSADGTGSTGLALAGLLGVTALAATRLRCRRS